MVQLESQRTFFSSSPRIFSSAAEMPFFAMRVLFRPDYSVESAAGINVHPPLCHVFRDAAFAIDSCRISQGATMVTEYVLLGAIGFLAQLVDGALGMAFGVISTTAMLSMGMPPAQASAIVHTAEIFTTGASAGSHLWHRNVDWRLVLRLGIAGVLGAALGAWVLSNLDAGFIRPYIAGYLLLVGIFI